MVPGLALGGILAFLLCAGLPLFVIKNQYLPFYSIIIIIIIIITIIIIIIIIIIILIILIIISRTRVIRRTFKDFWRVD